MKCYDCKKIIRTKGAHYCPFCGNLLHTYTRKTQYTELADKNQLTRIEKMLKVINDNTKEG